MSSTEIQLVFEGSAVQSGMIDAGVFAESLAGYSEIFRRANAIANGDASEAAVLVESNFKAGSFIAISAGAKIDRITPRERREAAG